MEIHLPKDFQIKMQQLLKDEADLFFEALKSPREAVLRINPLKNSRDEWEEISPFPVERIPFTKWGYYYRYYKDEPGKHPYHAAGVYYIQEPSAMFVAELLEAQPGERILDLCAAPGGKSTQIAASMNNEGLLISNEFVHKRAKILSENIERMGIRNTIVTNESPANLAKRFPDYFDRILVDAPCSGEGMFRKDPETIHHWSTEHVMKCHLLQKQILEDAYHMLKPGGLLVYSTCTFSPEENEQIIEEFLLNHPDLELEPIETQFGIEGGRPEWTKSGMEDVVHCARLWPHKVRGEGHFAAKIRKKANGFPEKEKRRQGKGRPVKQPKEFQSFVEEALNSVSFGNLQLIGNQLYTLPEGAPGLSGLKVVRFGLHLGELKKNRFEPNHALAMYLSPEHAKQVIKLDVKNNEWLSYLKGETLLGRGFKGWVLVTVGPFSLGWGKESAGIVKNGYPKGLRIKG